MKSRYLNVLLIIFLFSFLAFIPQHCRADIKDQYLEDSDGTDWDSKAMITATGTYYTDEIEQAYSKGHCSLLVLTSAGSLAITYEVSDDNVSWYTPKDTDGNALNVIATAMTANTWVVFSPTLAEYVRFKFILTGSNSTVTAIFTQME